MRSVVILETVIRFFLAAVMLLYGSIKWLGIQFALPDETGSITLNDIDGVTLAWAFLGYNKWMVILFGVMEILPAVLLLFRRTRLFGAVILFPVLCSVFVVNVAYGFLPHMIWW